MKLQPTARSINMHLAYSQWQLQLSKAANTGSPTRNLHASAMAADALIPTRTLHALAKAAAWNLSSQRGAGLTLSAARAQAEVARP